MNYTDLKSSVASWLHRTDLTATIPTFIAFAENRIYRDLRLAAMESPLSETITSGTIDVPEDYVELKYAYLDGNTAKKLTRKSAEWIYEKYPSRSIDGDPLFIARDGDVFIFGPYPANGKTIKGTYYRRLPALSGTNLTNWFTDNAFDLLLMASCLEASEYTRDKEGLLYWSGKYNALAAQLAANNSREEFSGSTLAMTAS